MTDKYEEFKEWFLGLRECDIPRQTKLEEMHFNNMAWTNPVYARTEYNRRKIFEKFEEEQEEKRKEKEVKEILMKYMPVHSSIMGTEFYISCIDETYDVLKEKELLR